MTAPTLEALAAEMQGPEHAHCTATGFWLTRVRAYLAARPASDLVRKLRALAERVDLEDLDDAHLQEAFSEAADALAAYEEYLTRTKSAHEQALIRKAENASALASRLQASLDEANARNTDQQKAYCMRITELERELAEEERETAHLGKRLEEQRVRAEAAEIRIAAVARYLDKAYVQHFQGRFYVPREEVRAALATSAQPNEGAP